MEVKRQIKNIGWTLGNDCPCKCKHCYSMSVREKGQNLTKEIVDKVIEQVEKIGVETINLGGNEPIFTNGLKVQDSLLPYILKELSKYPVKDEETNLTRQMDDVATLATMKAVSEYIRADRNIVLSTNYPFPNFDNQELAMKRMAFVEKIVKNVGIYTARGNIKKLSDMIDSELN